QTRVRAQEINGRAQLVGADAIRAAATGDAVVQVLRSDGSIIPPGAKGHPNLGSPLESLHDAGRYRVISRPIFVTELQDPVAFIQYAKPRDTTNGTIARIRLFLAAGVVGGALLALLAGLAVARRAMTPVKRLTRAAQEIARTRDAAVTLPKPRSE